MSCESCSTRGLCRLVKAREYYRGAVDLIVCDHSTFFDDLWTREEKLANGERPLLPEYSAIIFDEGHKVLLPAAFSAGRHIDKKEIDSMLLSIEKLQGARTSLISIVVALDQANSQFFEHLYQSAIRDERTNRLTIRVSEQLFQAAATLRRALDTLLFEFQNEQALNSHSLSNARLQAYEGIVERAMVALDRFYRNRGTDVVFWADGLDEVFWVVPRNLDRMLNQHLLTKGIPIVFSSATLSTRGDFSYFARTLGLQDFSSSTVKSAFEYEDQVLVYLIEQKQGNNKEVGFDTALKQLVALLKFSQGRALVLTNTPSEVWKIRRGLKEYHLPYEFLWEDSAERGYLIRRFRQETSSVLVGSGFWEGLDVPGEALSMLIIWQLPFPPREPLLEARKREMQEQGFDPVQEVEYPEMALRLKQGCGRLIRTREDRGAIAILDPILGKPWEQIALSSLPEGAKIVRSMEALTALWN